MRPIEPGPWDNENWVIYGGLKAGDQVIVSGVNKVLPGSPVKISKEIKFPRRRIRKERRAHDFKFFH